MTHRTSRCASLAIACWLVGLASCTPYPKPLTRSPDPLKAEAARAPVVVNLRLTVSSVERAGRFFRALDFEPKAERELGGDELAQLLALPSPSLRVATLELGSEQIELCEFAVPGRAISKRARSNDASFQHMALVVSDMDRAYQRVQELGVYEISEGPQTLPESNPAAGGIRAFYFRDPDRHALELIWFPPGKGASRWQGRSSRLFLGIDHTAIVVENTELGAPFYDALGFVVSGRSLNFGKEQAALSGVSGARVRITGFSALGGPGVEFLSYLAPASRETAGGSAASDLEHWELTLRVANVDEALQRAERAGGQRLSRRVVDVSALELGYHKAVVVRDRDGHSVRLVEP